MAGLPDIDRRHYRLDGMQMTELQPDTCPAGHPLRPGSVLLGWAPCLCSVGVTARGGSGGAPGHRLWSHPGCSEVATWPGCSQNPQWKVWWGIDSAAEPRPESR